ncbi:IclR family transcriptional regulator [Bradyrhizobium sp. NP1]|uniref:IclR family transcriptional regulator n=1 Tax=Bradyrhizobium sp. NP1 TaxID=3049772 RepID=UPI0025A63C85|nr:IclR family transcriptional regulator [Bradyrhizobium sp. NP1]WJR75874.1 IclR family transcriptional regulator [Bradyrhizobium sp. NP1]
MRMRNDNHPEARRPSKGDFGRLPSADPPGKAFPTVKAVSVLETIANARRPLSVSELGVLLGLPKPTAHRIVRMLESEGLMQREPGSRRLVPGPRLVRLGLSIVGAAMMSAPRHSILEALSQKIGETCNFGVINGSHVLYLDRVEAEWPLGLRFESGSRVPLHCTSMGKLFLSWLPKQRRDVLLRSIPILRYTENTITDIARLEADLEKIRASEVSIDNQEFLAGVVCVAVPVRDQNGHRVAALAISAPLARMSIERGLQHVPLMQKAAEELTATIDDDERDEE